MRRNINGSNILGLILGTSWFSKVKIWSETGLSSKWRNRTGSKIFGAKNKNLKTTGFFRWFLYRFNAGIVFAIPPCVCVWACVGEGACVCVYERERGEEMFVWVWGVRASECASVRERKRESKRHCLLPMIPKNLSNRTSSVSTNYFFDPVILISNIFWWLFLSLRGFQAMSCRSCCCLMARFRA